MMQKSTYDNLQFVVVLDTFTPNKVVEHIEQLGIQNLKIVWYDRPFNFSDKINSGVVNADGEYLMLLNDDTQVIDHDWCESMLVLFENANIGAVGSLLYFPDQKIQHAGHRYVDGNPTHVGIGAAFNNGGSFGELGCQREVSGVTAAALMTRNDTFFEVGGMSNEFPNNYNDVDFCMKLQHLGYSVLYTPYASMYHFESQSRDPKIGTDEHKNILRRWWRELHNDRFDAPIPTELVGRQKSSWRRKARYTPKVYGN
jgi:GT2 family glycosyltransferase